MSNSSSAISSAWLTLAQAGAVVVACVPATWAVATFSQSGELAGYKASKELALPEGIKELRAATADLRLSVDERKELVASQRLPLRIKALEDTVSSATGQISALRKELADRMTERDAAQEKLATLVNSGKSVVVMQGRSAYLIPNSVLVGVDGIGRSSCTVTLGGSWNVMSVGDAMSGTAAGFSYRVNLTATDENGCHFDVFATPVAAKPEQASVAPSGWFQPPKA